MSHKPWFRNQLSTKNVTVFVFRQIMDSFSWLRDRLDAFLGDFGLTAVRPVTMNLIIFVAVPFVFF